MVVCIFPGSEFNLSVKFKPAIPEIDHASAIYGIYSHVARKLGVTPQHVRQVARGERTSKRVSAEVRREVRRRTEKAKRRAA